MAQDPNKTVKLRNLVPNKKYRMVIDIPEMPSLSAPAIEFTVPPSPRLISTYQPTIKIDPEPYTVTTSYEEVVPGSTVNVAAENIAETISKFSGTDNTYNYVLRIPGRKPAIGTVLTVSGVSELWKANRSANQGTDPLYYDWIDYTVTSISGNDVSCTGSRGWRANSGSGSRKAWGQAPWDGIRRTVSPWTERDTRSWNDTKNANGKSFSGNSTTKSGMIAYWSIPGYSYKNPDGKVTKYTTETKYRYNATISLPQEIINTGVFDSSGSGSYRYLPVFFYIKNGRYYNFDNTEMTSVPLALNSIPDPIPVTGIDYDMGNDEAKDYRFTVARYKQVGQSWVPSWLQTDVTYQTSPSISKVIYSQTARKI